MFDKLMGKLSKEDYAVIQMELTVAVALFLKIPAEELVKNMVDKDAISDYVMELMQATIRKSKELKEKEIV